jgi:hypothetical protein
MPTSYGDVLQILAIGPLLTASHDWDVLWESELGHLVHDLRVDTLNTNG